MYNYVAILNNNQHARHLLSFRGGVSKKWVNLLPLQ
jgi:hypothetical protein